MYKWEFIFEVSERQKNIERVAVSFRVWRVDARTAAAMQYLKDRFRIFLDLKITRLRSSESWVLNCHKDNQRSISHFVFQFKTPTLHLCSSSRF
jgi:hypothetical protein